MTRPDTKTHGVITAAVIGLGWWGQKVVADLAHSSDIRVVLGVDPSPTARDALGRATGIPTAETAEAALSEPAIDAVLVCTPHRFHCDQIVAAAVAGKHVFCEKPLTTTNAEAERAIAAVRAAGVQLGVGHERRFEPAVVRLREQVRDGVLGVPLVFEGNFSQDKFLDLAPDNWRLSDIEAPVGPLSATGIHLVDLAIALLGRPVEVLARLSTQATTFANGDTLSITLGFEKGQTATITAVLTTPFIGRVALIGSEGWVEIRDRRHPEDPQGWDVVTTLRGQDTVAEFFAPHATVRSNLEAFARAVRGTESYPITLEEMGANVAAFEAITRSSRSGRPEVL